MEIVLHDRHGDAQVLAHEVVHRVTGGRPEQHCPSPAAKTLLNGRGLRENRGDCRSRCKETEPTRERRLRSWGWCGRVGHGVSEGHGPDASKICCSAVSSTPV